MPGSDGDTMKVSLKWIGVVWTAMAAIFGLAWAVYARDISFAMQRIDYAVTEIKDLRSVQLAQDQRHSDAMQRLWEAVVRLHPSGSPPERNQ